MAKDAREGHPSAFKNEKSVIIQPLFLKKFRGLTINKIDNHCATIYKT